MRSSPSGPLDRLLVRPPERRRVEPLLPRPFAHRGLHGPGRIENSRSAFEAAIARGHGIELDVQASADGQAIVFHDYELGRLTEEQGAVAERSAADLAAIRLKCSDDSIPTLAAILRLIAGRVPLLIEVKAPELAVTPLCRAVVRALQGYDGPAGIMSFNPEVSRWLSVNAPGAVRGLVVTAPGRRWRGSVQRRLAYWRARPDFLASALRALPSRLAARARPPGLPVFS